MYDVIIVGGGPAGLSAALLLGRCRRNVIVFDTGKPRNIKSSHLNGYLTRDGINPSDFLNISRKELQKYEIEFSYKEVTEAFLKDDKFEIIAGDNQHYTSKKLLLTTGIKDRIPAIEGIDAFYGMSIFHCPYCDAWDFRDQPIGVYGKLKMGLGLSFSLKTWSEDITLFTDGMADFSAKEALLLNRNHIKVYMQGIKRLEGKNANLENVIFDTDESIPCSTLFFSNGYEQHCGLAKKFNCRFTQKGGVYTDHHQQSNVPGLYVAGDASRDMQLVIVAAAEGAKAGVSINMALQKEYMEQIIK